MEAPFKLIDVHVHLDEMEESEIAKAVISGVVRMVGVGMDLPSNRTILKLSRVHIPYVLAAFGCHPWRLQDDDWCRNLEWMEKHIYEAVAIGEVGLDYGAKVPKALQREVFNEVLSLARRAQKPLILHCRYSHAKVLEMITEAGIKKAVFHWFSGPPSSLKEILERGYYISATPALAYSQKHIAAVRETPLEAILLETDSPVEYEGRPSVPSDIKRTLQLVAGCKGVPPKRVAEVTTRNALRFLGLSQEDL